LHYTVIGFSASAIRPNSSPLKKSRSSPLSSFCHTPSPSFFAGLRFALWHYPWFMLLLPMDYNEFKICCTFPLVRASFHDVILIQGGYGDGAVNVTLPPGWICNPFLLLLPVTSTGNLSFFLPPPWRTLFPRCGFFFLRFTFFLNPSGRS